MKFFILYGKSRTHYKKNSLSLIIYLLALYLLTDFKRKETRTYRFLY